MPFAHNDATRYISPTKTPEYLAAGCPVASTRIHDVVEPYERLGLVAIGDGAAGFADACGRARAADRAARNAQADRLLAEMSWDRTWSDIDALITTAIESRSADANDRVGAAVLGPADGLVSAARGRGGPVVANPIAALE
jgi:UDP-galactopyranose mutase